MKFSLPSISKIFGSRAKKEYEEELFKFKATHLKAQRQQLERLYEAASQSQYWPRRGDNRSGNAVMDNAKSTLRSWARFLDENHDVAIAILDDITNKVIGCGTDVTPVAMTASGTPAVRFNTEVKKLWKEWTRSRPDTTRSFSWVEIENLSLRSMLRDGELLVQHVEGLGAPIRHRSRVPYSIELIEADYLPFDLQRASTPEQNRVVHGVELTDWREPVAFWLYKEHPGDSMLVSNMMVNLTRDFKRISADFITHIKFTRRFSQVRGVPIFHAVIRRLEDIKEYEESERIAARVAAAMCAVITKSVDFQGAVDLNSSGERTMEFNPGMIFDNLAPGEKVEMIGSERPNANMDAFVKAQMRRVAGGTGATYSGISKDYNGTYSSQRQELVEGWTAYEKLREIYHDHFIRQIYMRFVRMAVLANLVSLDGVDKSTIFNVDCVGAAMPWIDPTKEVEGYALKVENGFMSRQMVVREMQYDVEVVDQQIKNDPLRELLKESQAEPKEPEEPSPAEGSSEDDSSDSSKAA